VATTIRDVAKAAGVSTSTVSRALSRPDIVDAATRDRVLRVAEHLGYHPNRAARGLITGRTGNLGLILPDLANPFFPSVVKGIQQQAGQADYQVFVADTDEDPTAELGLVRTLAKQVDGIILCSPRMKPAELREAASLATIVMVNRRAGSLPAVAIDNGDGARQAVDHLVGLGHQRIGFVAGPRSSWSSRERLRGLRSSVDSAGVELAELGSFAPTFDGGRAAVDSVVTAGVTAVVAYNDLVALGLCSALRDRGVDVPRELSIVGFDDIPMSAMVQPALTTVAIPKEQAGREAVDLLLHLLTDPSARTGVQRDVAMSLLVRDTTAEAPDPTTRPSGRGRLARR
jgi:DNA-binding LacI/PurR family transcriptional regulator